MLNDVGDASNTTSGKLKSAKMYQQRMDLRAFRYRDNWVKPAKEL